MPRTASIPDSPYVRGASGGTVSGRQVAGAIVAVSLLALAAVAIALLVETGRRNADLRELKAHGVAVSATVTGCTGNLSGTGITAAGFTCRVRYQLTGTGHQAVLRGTSALYAKGSSVPAVTSLNDPTLVYLAAAVARADTSWRRYIVPGALLITTVVGAVVGFVVLKRTPAGRRAEP